ncbi:ATPase with role in protein import into the ER [Tulasnella sp. UAMH 9824]|nr:ATPase with role in protein import into the ER [Tulasnella sp. UAMH 9824]
MSLISDSPITSLNHRNRSILIKKPKFVRTTTPESATSLTRFKRLFVAFEIARDHEWFVVCEHRFTHQTRSHSIPVLFVAVLSFLLFTSSPNPTTAAIALSITNSCGADEYHIIVYDLGRFISLVIEYTGMQYKKMAGIDVSKDYRALGKLKREVERPSVTSPELAIESLEGGIDVAETRTRTRTKFEEINNKPVEQALFSSSTPAP